MQRFKWIGVVLTFPLGGESRKMMNTVGHYVYFMQFTVACSDGELEQGEIDDIIERAAALQFMGMMSGRGGDQGAAIDEAAQYHDQMVNTGQIGMAFANAAGGVAATLNYDREALSEFYNSLVSVAAADGEIEPSERQLLDFVQREWGV